MKKMTLAEIQDLIKFVAKSGATEVDLQFDDFKICIKSPPKKKRGHVEEQILIPQSNTNQAITNPVIEEQILTNSNQVKNNSTEEDSNDNYTTIKSSMIGTFYRSSSPEKPSFINIGDTIKEGDTICIIEAMKLFNEIESEVSGTVIKVLVDDASPIEFDQPLFLIDPS